MSHLALGDYIYQGVFLKQLANTYPHLRIDIWFDDCRDHHKTWHSGRNQILSQWLESEPNVGTVYANPSSPQQRQAQLEQAKSANYDIVFFIATQRSERFCQFARDIAGANLACGAHGVRGLKRIFHKGKINALNASLAITPSNQFDHISDFYQHHFSALIEIPAPSSPFQHLSVPQHYLDDAKASANSDNLVFINHLSTTQKRDWQFSQVLECIRAMHVKDPQLQFVINAPSEQLALLEEQIQRADLQDITIVTFSAQQHFYQLPAMMSQARLVISVETAIMHLAASLGVPAVALIREKARQWRPLGPGEVLVGGKRVDSINAQDVADKALALLANA
ncbi:glycosyltransferase family 9 protein [Pseudoalteromonas sp. SSDWG2]|uniref:glycosyltransferase family 9 protein n=1 Tax=Pseudoalteromonas sp. SSDWG2 TaxID=3139391 RepID=UPI003BAB5DD0